MEVKLNQFDNWISDDPAEINFGVKDGRGRLPNNPSPPEKVLAIEPTTYCPNTGDGSGRSTVELANLTYVGTITGGIRNEGTRNCYTTDYQNFHIYTHDRLAAVDVPIRPGGPNVKVSRRKWQEVVICEVNGTGNHWFLIDSLDKGTSILHAVEHLPNDVAWDILDLITSSYETGHQNGSVSTAKEYRQAFVEGRLKKRKVRGQQNYKVQIVEVNG